MYHFIVNEMLKLLYIISIFGTCLGNYDLVLLTKKRSSFLENYRSYASLAISQVVIPPQTTFVSFKISAESFDLSIFGCSPEIVHVYVKRGSLPVLNPDNSRNPLWVRNISKSEIHGLEILTNKKFSYINITSPEAGIYYFVAYFPYVNPDRIAVKQKGLSQQCTGFINILGYIAKATVKLITENYIYHLQTKKDESYFYQFSTTPNIKEVILKLRDIRSSDDTANITLRLSCETLPSKDKFIETKTISASDKELDILYWLNKDGRYFLEFDFDKQEELDTSLKFSLNLINIDQTFRRQHLRTTLSSKVEGYHFKSAVIDYYQDKYSEKIEPYIFYDLIKESGSEAFLYTFNINHEEENEFMIPVPLNLTNEDFTVLKFEIDDIIDIGGTFEFSIDFRPPVDNEGNVLMTPKSSDNIIIGCISQDIYEIPTLPRHCMKDGVRSLAPIVINNTADNSTVLIPFPEAGVWYVTLKLFCQPCRNCHCYKECSQRLQACVAECNCNTLNSCTRCSRHCKAINENNNLCKNCNCDGGCEASQKACKSAVMFDLSSFPCIMGKCGPNGRCQFVVADGYIFSACSCRNKYRGMDCTDDSDATPFWKVVLGQFLLIASNIIMLPCVYIAWRRKYYPEAVMYSSVFLFSSFYHACDVSDDAIQFCITTHASLQFGDFFSALFSIWATMIAISDIELTYRATLHTFAAIVLAYCTVIDKTGIWIFLMIAIPGLIIIGISWFFKYRRSGKGFIEKKYFLFHFSSGAIVMGIGILIFAFLQTSGNYMYLHSLWHCIVGVTVLLILPKRNTFPPSNDL